MLEVEGKIFEFDYVDVDSVCVVLDWVVFGYVL